MLSRYSIGSIDYATEPYSTKLVPTVAPVGSGMIVGVTKISSSESCRLFAVV